MLPELVKPLPTLPPPCRNDGINSSLQPCNRKEFLITRCRLTISELVIIKLQTNGTGTNGRAWNFGAHLKGDSFLGLNVENQIIGAIGSDSLVAKSDSGGVLNRNTILVVRLVFALPERK